MTQTIEVESIRRLDIKPGEILVVTLPDEDTGPADVARADAAVRALLPDGVKLIVTNRRIGLDVLCPSSPA